MQWWNSFSDWTASAHGWRLLSGAIIPFVAIVVAGVIAALIGRGATKRVVAMQEREAKNAAVAGVISAARKAATWGSLGHDERSYADHLAEDADIRLRLLPVAGAPVAANWAQHEIADIKRNSSTFSFQAEQSLSEFRDRMLDWQARPSRARKLFRADLERWKFETPDPNADLVQRQQEWNADQADGARGASAGSGVTVGSGAAPARQQPIAPVLPRVDRAAVPDRSAAGSDRAVPSARPGATTTTTDRPSGTTRSAEQAERSEQAESSPTAAPATALAPAVAVARSAASDEPDRSSRPEPSTPPTSPARPTSAASADRGVAPMRLGTPERPAGQTAVAVVPVSPGAVREDDGDRPTGALTAPKVDAAEPVGTSTTSIPTRIADGPVELADPDETAEAPYGSPVSAAELRRRGEDDED